MELRVDRADCAKVKHDHRTKRGGDVAGHPHKARAIEKTKEGIAPNKRVTQTHQNDPGNFLEQNLSETYSNLLETH